jgi:hypothetical protein
MRFHLIGGVSFKLYFLPVDILFLFIYALISVTLWRMSSLKRNLLIQSVQPCIQSILREDQYTFLIISRSLLLRMRNFSYKFVDEIKTHILCSMIFFFENGLFCEIIWKNIVQPDRPQMTIRRMRIAWWIPKATNTQTGYVTFVALPLQQFLHQRASLLRYTYIACVVIFLY